MAKKAKVPLNILVAEGTRTIVKHLANVLECSQGEVVDRALVLLAANEDIAKGLAGVTIPNGAIRSTGLALSPLMEPAVDVTARRLPLPSNEPDGCVECGSLGGHKMSCERGNRLAVQRQAPDLMTRLDATGPELSSGKGKATVETRGIRPKGDSKR